MMKMKVKANVKRLVSFDCDSGWAETAHVIVYHERGEIQAIDSADGRGLALDGCHPDSVPYEHAKCLVDAALKKATEETRLVRPPTPRPAGHWDGLPYWLESQNRGNSAEWTGEVDVELPKTKREIEKEKATAWNAKHPWVAGFLAAAYAANENPLPILRKVFPGQWSYEANMVWYCVASTMPIWNK